MPLALREFSDGEWEFVSEEFPRRIINEYYDIVEASQFPKLECDDLVGRLVDIITEYPLFLDAYSLLGTIFEDCDCDEEAQSVFTVAWEIAAKAIPKEFDFSRHKLNDSHRNRPFLRAYYNWGWLHLQKARNPLLSFLKKQNLLFTAEIYQNIISLNERDIGAAEILIECYLFLCEYDKILEVCKIYQNETQREGWGCEERETTSADILYGRVLAAVKLKKRYQAQQWVQIAISRRPLIAQILLLETPHPPVNYNPSLITSNGADEAYLSGRFQSRIGFRHSFKIYLQLPGECHNQKHIIQKLFNLFNHLHIFNVVLFNQR